jgi:competence protein ComEC
MDELKLSLFSRKRELFALILFLSILFSFNIFLKYKQFQDFKSSKYFKTSAIVLSQYIKTTKKGKKYTVLKLKTDNSLKFYGISWQKNLKNMQSDRIKLKINTKKISFYRYLKGFFAPVYGMKIISPNAGLKQKISTIIQNEHKNRSIKELFSALFLGTSLQKNLRKKIQTLGISHLVAISGFHLGVLSAILFFILTPIYRFFQDKFFPYRNLRLDLMIVTLFLLFGYLYLVGFMPSLIRAYTMLVIIYILYIRHIEIISFQTLALTTVLLLSFFPNLLFSISFWFSISGVFYIFLFLRYFPFLKPWQIIILLNFWVYLMMQPIVHAIFGLFSLYQIYSPILSMLFIIFYPLELFLHIINHGDLLDGMILKLFSIKASIVQIKTPLWFLILFILFSLFSAYKKIFLYILVLLDILFFGYLILSKIS